MWICRWWRCGKGKIFAPPISPQPSLCPSLFRSDSAIYKPISNPLPFGRRNRMKTTKTAKEKLAGLVRVISIPPVMVTALLLILYFWGPQPFCPVGELVTTILLLGFVPVLAYPAQPFCGRCWRGSRRRSAPSVPGIFSRRCSLPCATACFTGAPAGTRAARPGRFCSSSTTLAGGCCCPVL